MKRALPLLVVLLGAGCAGRRAAPRAASSALIPGEALALSGSERELAVFIYRTHYDNMLEAFRSFRLTGLSRQDPAKEDFCEIKVSLDLGKAASPDQVFDGLPSLRAQPGVFASIQGQVTSGLTNCASKVHLTSRSWKELRDRIFGLLAMNSGSTFCLKDADCGGFDFGRDYCGASGSVRLVGSETTDWVFAYAWSRYMPGILAHAASAVNDSIQALGKEHPDYPRFDGLKSCRWATKPLKLACVRHSCR